METTQIAKKVEVDLNALAIRAKQLHREALELHNNLEQFIYLLKRRRKKRRAVLVQKR